MNRKSLAITATSHQGGLVALPRSVAILRKILIRVLNQASEGHFLLKENGRVIAEVGMRQASLQAEVDVLDTRVYARALLGGDAAAGEAYVEGWWTSPDLTAVTRFFARNLGMMDYWGSRFGWLLKPVSLARQLARTNTRARARKNILAHYDIGNDLYQAFLDDKMQYSSAIYNHPGESLSEAQTNKLRRLCDSLQLASSDHLLEVGTGWGGLALFAARNYGCRVTTTTISDEQFEYARTQISAAGLDDRIELLKQDYRQLEGQYDKIVSVEMIEAVGERYLPGFFRKLDSLLKPNGRMMLQAITIADQRFREYREKEDFIQKHIFPGGFLPSIALMAGILAGKTDMVIRDVRDIGLDYAQTLAHWREAFLAKQDQLQARGFDEAFRNLWLYYLGYCEGGFLEKRISAVQLLATKAPHRG